MRRSYMACVLACLLVVFPEDVYPMGMGKELELGLGKTRNNKGMEWEWEWEGSNTIPPTDILGRFPAD